MIRLVYLIPYFIWFLITIILIENSLINDKPHLFAFIILSLIIAFVLEVIRNRWLNYESLFNKTRLILFLVLNLLIGIPLFLIIVIVSVPLDVSGLLGLNDQFEYGSWQQYLAIGYVFLWFVINAILLKPRDIKRILLFFSSLIIMGISSSIFGLVMGLMSTQINVIE
jgi:hypothetical protein